MNNTTKIQGFEFFWSETGKLAIANLKRNYLNNNYSLEEGVIASAFIKSNNTSLNKIIRAIQLEQKGLDYSGSKLSPIENIMIKPVSDLCNLQCIYCYEGEMGKRYSASVMKMDTLSRITEQALQNSKSHLSFLWHGGEPTLAGIDFFKTAIKFQEKYNKNQTNISNVIQTNGINLTKEWIDFFKLNKFFIGFSLDGSKELNDLERIDHKGNGSFDRVMKSIKLLQAENIEFGIITVINKNHKGKANQLFEFFIGEGILNFDIHPGYGNHFQLPPTDYSEFVIDIFDAWLKLGREDINITIFSEIFKVMNGDRPATCYYAGTCTKIFAIESDGNIVPCTRPFDRQLYTFGNINEQILSDILTSKKHNNFRINDLRAQANSKNCPWYSMCHNGCPQHRIKDGKSDVEGANLYCKCQSNLEGGNYAIWEHITSKVANVLLKGQP